MTITRRGNHSRNEHGDQPTKLRLSEMENEGHHTAAVMTSTGRGKRIRNEGNDHPTKLHLSEMENDGNDTAIVMTSIGHGKRMRNEGNDHPTKLHLSEMENDGHDTAIEKTKTRGKTYMPRIWMTRDRMKVAFNKLGQPIGPNKGKFVEFLGTLVRNGKLVRLDIKSWHRVPRSVKNSLIEIVKEKFTGAPGFENWAEMNLGKKWKSWKNRVKKNFFDPNLSLEENLNKRPNTEDERVLLNQWKNLVIYWNSDASKEESARNKENRAKKLMHHVTGKKSFAQVEEQIKDEIEKNVENEDVTDSNSIDIDELSRADLFARCYTRKGRTSNPIVANSLQMMEELKSKLAPDAKDIGPDDIFSQVNGQDKWGKARMYGFGVNASDVFDENSSRAACYRRSKSYQVELDKMMKRANEQDRKIEEQNRQIQELMRMNKKRLESLDSPQEVMKVPSSSSYLPTTCRRRSTSSVNNIFPRVGNKVSLKSMYDSKKTIAIGRIESLDPSREVGEIQLGKNWCDVRVNVGVEINEELIRPILDCTTVGEAIGRNIAWPIHLVLTDEE